MKSIRVINCLLAVILPFAFTLNAFAESFPLVEDGDTYEEIFAKSNHVEYIRSDKGDIVDMGLSHLDVPFTLTLAVCPIQWDTEIGQAVSAFSGKMADKLPDSGKKAVRDNKYHITIYNDKGNKTNEYDLWNDEIYSYDIENDSYEYLIDGWLDVEGNFVYCLETYEVKRSTYSYCTGIGMNVYENLDKFDDIRFTDNGIMIIELTQTLREYNLNQYGEEMPSINSSGERINVQKIYSANTHLEELSADPYAVEWYTPRGELILKSEGTWGKTYYTRLYGEIMGGRYRHNDHKTLDDTSPALEPSDVLVMDSDGSGTLYIGSDGTFARGWKTIAGSRYYFKKDGYAATGRATIGGIRYTFDENGVCKGRYSGWTKSSKGYRYYYKGKMLKGYYRIGGTSYYFNEKGYAARAAA